MLYLSVDCHDRLSYQNKINGLLFKSILVCNLISFQRPIYWGLIDKFVSQYFNLTLANTWHLYHKLFMITYTRNLICKVLLILNVLKKDNFHYKKTSYLEAGFIFLVLFYRIPLEYDHKMMLFVLVKFSSSLLGRYNSEI